MVYTAGYVGKPRRGRPEIHIAMIGGIAVIDAGSLELITVVNNSALAEAARTVPQVAYMKNAAFVAATADASVPLWFVDCDKYGALVFDATTISAGRPVLVDEHANLSPSYAGPLAGGRQVLQMGMTASAYPDSTTTFNYAVVYSPDAKPLADGAHFRAYGSPKDTRSVAGLGPSATSAIFYSLPWTYPQTGVKTSFKYALPAKCGVIDPNTPLPCEMIEVELDGSQCPGVAAALAKGVSADDLTLVLTANHIISDSLILLHIAYHVGDDRRLCSLTVDATASFAVVAASGALYPEGVSGEAFPAMIPRLHGGVTTVGLAANHVDATQGVVVVSDYDNSGKLVSARGLTVAGLEKPAGHPELAVMADDGTTAWFITPPYHYYGKTQVIKLDLEPGSALAKPEVWLADEPLHLVNGTAHAASQESGTGQEYAFDVTDPFASLVVSVVPSSSDVSLSTTVASPAYDVKQTLAKASDGTNTLSVPVTQPDTFVISVTCWATSATSCRYEVTATTVPLATYASGKSQPFRWNVTSASGKYAITPSFVGKGASGDVFVVEEKETLRAYMPTTDGVVLMGEQSLDGVRVYVDNSNVYRDATEFYVLADDEAGYVEARRIELGTLAVKEHVRTPFTVREAQDAALVSLGWDGELGVVAVFVGDRAAVIDAATAKVVREFNTSLTDVDRGEIGTGVSNAVFDSLGFVYIHASSRLSSAMHIFNVATGAQVFVRTGYFGYTDGAKGPYLFSLAGARTMACLQSGDCVAGAEAYSVGSVGGGQIPRFHTMTSGIDAAVSRQGSSIAAYEVRPGAVGVNLPSWKWFAPSQANLNVDALFTASRGWIQAQDSPMIFACDLDIFPPFGRHAPICDRL
ncbi:uncharacterized protein AMSG_08842 [Thecamonas trahens ATCC 50062]|uniref:Uncharacterized protein n=1 Tax=Thecamonas trahens ATCC 50062 TaxID=461836 RepID=A0A0L0DMS3_THETB|nr:hypothetical protein AMSG_08842 [Thecamonas trahens ATCC 50062]KNC53341.1 hypothetical protein AMSG_08842 [Thecamonas trahens ATCC 50062]|eukprot:XP_013754389.1 hypothetical protein AMSG_08842 [Thecamonas trahens ATCC 50062]